MTQSQVPESNEKTVWDLLAAFRQAKPGEISRKAITAARVWAAAFRPDLLRRGLSEDEVLREITVRGYLP